MIGNVIKYGAVCAKVRAMWGKRLTQADWNRLQACTTPAQVRDILRQSPSWAAAGEAEDTSGNAIMGALKEQLSVDCRRLGGYLSNADAASLKVFLDMRSSDRAISAAEYSRWWSSLRRDPVLRSLIGADVDALNLVYVLRLRRFGATDSQAASLLIPVKQNFTPEMVGRLLAMKSDEEVLSWLGTTRWKNTFRSLEAGVLERQYREYLQTFCRHVMNSAQPGMAVVQAFLELKDLERARLNRLIGAVERGIDPGLVV